MDWLGWLFLESLPALAIALGLTLFGLLVYWRRGGSPRPLLIGLAITAVLLGVQAVIETPREVATRMLIRIERDVVAGRATALAAALAPQFRTEGMDRTAFIEFARQKIQQVRVRSVDRGECRIEERTGDRFVASVNYQTNVDVRDWGAAFVPSHWRITFGRTDAGWRIVTIDPPQVGGEQFRDWNITP